MVLDDVWEVESGVMLGDVWKEEGGEGLSCVKYTQSYQVCCLWGGLASG